MITLTLAEFRRLVTTCAPATTKDDYGTPALRGVHLFTEGGRLYAEATDRYIAIRAVGPEVSGKFAAVIPLDRCKLIIAAFKSSWIPSVRAEDTDLKLSIKGKKVVVASDRGPSDTLTIEPITEAYYPNLGKVFTAAVTAEPSTDQPYGLNPHCLAKLPARGPGEYVQYRAVRLPFWQKGSGTRVIAAFIAASWIALVAPQRPTEDEQNLATWRERLAPEETAA